LDFLAKNPDQQAKRVMSFGGFIFLIWILGGCWEWICAELLD